jgi:hypothetical protein
MKLVRLNQDNIVDDTVQTNNPGGYPGYIEAPELVTVGWSYADGQWQSTQDATDFVASQTSANIAARIKKDVLDAHDRAVEYVNDFGDGYAWTQMTDWKYDPAVSEVAKGMIASVAAWKNNVMGKYLLVYKPAILSGGTPTIDYSDCGPRPYSFTEISENL